MKKALAVALVLCLLAPCAVAEEPDNYLIELIKKMDVDMLEYVKSEIEKEIERKRMALVASPDYYGDWEVAYFVDEFGDFTDSPYIRNKSPIFGDFSNSATNNSMLRVRWLFTKRPRWMLFEYGTSQVKNSYSQNTEYYQVIAKDQNGNRTNLRACIPAGGDRFEFYSNDDDKLFLDLMNTPQILSVYIIDEKYKTDKYLFEFDTSGFSNIYQKTFGK